MGGKKRKEETAAVTKRFAVSAAVGVLRGKENMVKHVILWKLKDEIEDKAPVKAGIKAGLEGLKGVVPGLVDIAVRTEGLASSNADVMLDSTFESEEALKGYAVHPAHVEVANRDVRPYTQTRLCLDFEV
jgi:hypothetical protein